MKSNYKRLGDYVQLVDERNVDLRVTTLLGLTVNKKFIPSVANTIGANMKNYKIIHKNQFACSLMQVRRDKKMPIALLKEFDEAIISQAYPVFEVIDSTVLNPDYLMMWFSRKEFDRLALFLAVGGVRGSLEWEDFMNTELPIPTIEKQNEIVKEYNTVVNRIKLNEQLNQKLEETLQAIYKHWFVDFDNIDNANLVPLDKYVQVNPKLTIKKGKDCVFIEMASVQENKSSIINTVRKKYSSGTKFMNNDTIFARITPSLENGKSGFVNFLNSNEIGFGSTEFIILRAKDFISPFWNYCLTKDENFRSYAISGMTGTSGRQRVDAEHIKKYMVREIDIEKMERFDKIVSSLLKQVKLNSIQNQELLKVKELLLSKMTKV